MGDNPISHQHKCPPQNQPIRKPNDLHPINSHKGDASAPSILSE